MNESCSNNNTFCAFFEEQVKRNPLATAIISDNQIFSYENLNKSANKLAHFLKTEKKLNLGTFVGVYMDRTPLAILAILAISKSGGAYLPIDPEYPHKRIDFMLSDSSLKIILTQENTYLENYSGDIVFLGNNFDEFSKLFYTYPEHNLISPYHKNDLAYVLYTSGTTGKPKGVMIKQSSLINAYHGWKLIYDLKENDSHLQMANLAFDVFTGDLLRALLSGGKLVLCPRKTLLNPQKLYELMLEYQITIAEFVPTVMRKLADYLEDEHLNLNFMRVLLCGSDSWSMGEYRRFKKLCVPHTRLINSYGLTEATIDSSYFEENKDQNIDLLDDHAVPIGKPFPNTKIYICDEELNEITDHQAGEICIAGKGLAVGYLNREELTRQRFTYCTTSNSSEWIYRTGDRGRKLASGDIDFLSRFDTQVKIRGHRIELSDIEHAANGHPSVHESIAVSHGTNEHKRLILFLTLKESSSTPLDSIRNYLVGHLPNYMLPSTYIILESLPVLQNGKLDRKHLIEHVKIQPQIMEHAITNTLEEKIIIIWQKLSGIKKIGLKDYFIDLGADSIFLAEMAVEVSRHFSIHLETCELIHINNIEGLAQIIRSKMNSCSVK